MKKVFALSALLVITAAICTAYKWPDDGIHRYDTSFDLSKHEFADTIPIIYSGHQIYIPVYIDGQRHLFNLDTGSSQGIAYSGTGINYSQPLGNINSRDANGRIDTIKVVRFPTISLGSPSGLALQGYVGSLLTRPGRHYFYDGVIGFDIFNKGLQAKIDTRKGYMILTDRKDFFKSETGLRMKYKLKRWTPYVSTVPFLNVKEPALFDTGLSDFYVISRTTFDRYRVKDPRVPMLVEEATYGSNTEGVYGPESGSLKFYVKLPLLIADKARFAEVHGYTTQGDTKIGAALLDYGSLIIDGKKKTMLLRPYDSQSIITVDNKVADIAMTDIDGRPTITTIRHRSELYRKGLREGDIILKVNGKTVSASADVVLTKDTKLIVHDSRGFNKEIDL